jgi:hypothetical protein
MPTIQHWQGWRRQWTEETDGRPCTQRSAVLWSLCRRTLVGRSVVVSGNLGEVLRPGRPASIFPTRVHTTQQEAFQMVSERCHREHVQRGDSRECDAHVMSAGVERECWTSHTPHLATVKAAALPISNYRRCWLPSRVRSLDKRAGCTTSVLLDVEAAPSDRTHTNGGVSRDGCVGDHACPISLAPA